MGGYKLYVVHVWVGRGQTFGSCKRNFPFFYSHMDTTTFAKVYKTFSLTHHIAKPHLIRSTPFPITPFVYVTQLKSQPKLRSLIGGLEFRDGPVTNLGTNRADSE